MSEDERHDDETRPKTNGDLAALVIEVPGAEFVEVPALLPVLPVRDVVVFPGVGFVCARCGYLFFFYLAHCFLLLWFFLWLFCDLLSGLYFTQNFSE